MASVTLRMAWSMVSPVDTQPGMSGTVTPYWLPRLFWIRMGMSMVLPQRRRGGGAGGAGIVSSVIQDGIDIKHFRGRVRFGVVVRLLSKILSVPASLLRRLCWKRGG